MKLLECQIGMIVQETEKYRKDFNKENKRIGWIKDLSVNLTGGIILVIRCPLKIVDGYPVSTDISLHPSRVEKLKG